MKKIIALMIIVSFSFFESIFSMRHPQDASQLTDVKIYINNGDSLREGVSQTYFKKLLMLYSQEKSDEKVAALKQFIVAHRASILSRQEFPGKINNLVGPIRFLAESAKDEKDGVLIDFLIENNFEWCKDDGVLDPSCGLLLHPVTRKKIAALSGYNQAVAHYRKKDCKEITCSLCFLVAFSGLILTAGYVTR